MKILVVEDENGAAQYLRKGLRESGFQVDLARDGEEGLHLALEGGYGLLVVDVMLPGLDGFSLVTQVRQARIPTPVLFLTARDSVADRVKGLELGADDYMVKPFAFSELLARVRTLLRRTSPQMGDVLRVADLELDVLGRKVKRQEAVIELTTKEYLLLALLVRRRGEVLSRTLIAEQVWDMNFDSNTNVVDVAVRRLRAKVDDPFPRKLIHTVRGMGYVLDERD